MSRIAEAVKAAGWETKLSVGLISLAAFIPALNSALTDAPKVRAMLPNLGLGSIWPYVPAILVSLAAAVWTWKTVRAPKRPAADTGTVVVAPTMPSPTTLTHEQLAFRIALKQFAMTYPERLKDGVARVRAVQINHIKALGDQDYSYALFHAMHFAWSSNGNVWQIKKLADVPIEEIHVDQLQIAILDFFKDYRWDQRTIANLNMLTKMDLRALPETAKWLAADKDCAAEIDKLKVWPEGFPIRMISQDEMAIAETYWTTPERVNF